MDRLKTYEGNGCNVTIADPGSITRDECLVLARCGADAWNSWRSEFPVQADLDPPKNQADFSDQDFRTNSINFSRFKFGGYANFGDAQFGDWVQFTQVEFGDFANFEDAKFGNWIDFEGAQFGTWANFAGAEFGYELNFSSSKFGSTASFAGVRFGEHARFENSIFGSGAKFSVARFEQDATFVRARFEQSAHFDGAHFGIFSNFSSAGFKELARFNGVNFGIFANFVGVQFGNNTSFVGSRFGDGVRFDAEQSIGKTYKPDEYEFEAHQIWANECNISPTHFEYISFDGVQFDGSVSFENRTFKRGGTFSILSKGQIPTELLRNEAGQIERDKLFGIDYKVKDLPVNQPVRFGLPPQFHGCSFHQNFSFDGALFPEAKGAEAAARSYRTLKLAFAQQQAIREEQRFFKLEMEEEAKRETGGRLWLYRLYKATSDFGFSAWLPLKTLILYPALFFSLLYLAVLAIAHPNLLTTGLANYPELLSKWLQFTLANMVPLPDSGFLKELRASLFAVNPWASVFALIFEILQKSLTLVGYFLIGLALRNLFKMK